MVDNYYIYIYLDPRKYGKCCYENFSFLYKPIYVGKGKNNRYKLNYKRNEFFKNKINKIKKLGLEPIVFKLYENLNEEKSFEFEKNLIKEIGRLDLGTGPLLNMTDGGEGISGYKHTEKNKNRIRKNQPSRNNENNPMFGKYHSIETKIIMSKKRKGEDNPIHKLIKQEIIQIKLLLKEKISQRKISKIFGVSQTVISNIKTEKTWSHIKI
jgi:hypothetical protein